MSQLSKEKLADFYRRRIQPGIARHGRGRPPWRQPTVLFILGQPGAGKTTMQAAAMDRLGMKKAYVLDHDELLEKHPEYAGAALDNDYNATVGHAEDAAQWRALAFQDVQARRMDVVVPYPIGDLDMMRSFQQQGYRVEVAIAAVHESQSQLGIMERFNDSRREVGYGRWISAEQHDQLYHALLDTADAIEAHGAADGVHVYRRGEAEPVFTNERKNGVWRHQIGSSRWAIETERNRPWTDREVNHFVRGYNKLAELARRPLKDHFKAMPLMATREGHRLLAKLHQTAAPKLAEHQRLTALKAQADAAAQQTQHPQQSPQQPWPPQQAGQQPQMPPPPRYAPHQQHVPQPWQEQAPAQQPTQRWQHHPQQPVQQPQQPVQQPQQGRPVHDWERFAVRLQTEQSPASGISVPVADTNSQAEGEQRPQRGAAQDERRGGGNGQLAR